MTELFKQMVEENYYDEIFNELDQEIADNYCQYDLENRGNVVCEVLAASLDDIEIMRIYDIKQEEEEVIFKVLVSCYIEISDFAYKEDISEVICQWFELECSAVLEDTFLKDFTVDEISAFNK